MTEEFHFRAKQQKKKTFPRLERSLLTDEVQFGPDIDTFTVYVTSQAVKDLKEGTRAKKPNEAFGQLMGKTYIDTKGYFTVILGAVYAQRAIACMNFVQLTSEHMGELRHQAKIMYPTAEFVGWTHSHETYSLYSAIDYIEQQTWTESHNVGILTFMDEKVGFPWAVAFRGPFSQVLHLSGVSSDIINLYSSSPISHKQDRSGMER